MISEAAALLLGVAFGAAYNAAFDRWGQGQNITALWVVFGVLATLALAALPVSPGVRLAIEWHGQPLPLSNAQHAAFHVLKYFCATGAPMLIGAARRSLAVLE